MNEFLQNKKSISKEEFIHLYESGVGVKEIAKIINKSPASVYILLYKCGAKVKAVGRPKKQSNIISKNEIRKGIKLSDYKPPQRNELEFRDTLKNITIEVVKNNSKSEFDELVEQVLEKVYNRLYQDKDK